MEIQKEQGGPAFPQSITEEGEFGAKEVTYHFGASLRDYFAAKAMQAVPMRQGELHDVPEAYARVARHAYKMADAMLRAREVES
jgi:hypothetical protein